MSVDIPRAKGMIAHGAVEYPARRTCRLNWRLLLALAVNAGIWAALLAVLLRL